MSDIVFCLIFAAYLPVHSVMTLGPAHLSPASPVMAALTLAAAGVNTGVLLSFVFGSALAAPFVSFPWTSEQIVACAYVLILALMLERRASLLFASGDWAVGPDSSYKALPRELSSETLSRVPSGVLDGRQGSLMCDEDGPGSDGEDPSSPLPEEHSTGAFLGQLFSRLRTDVAQVGRSNSRSRHIAAAKATSHNSFHGPDFEHTDPTDQSLPAYQSLSLPAPTQSLLSSADLATSGSYLRGVKLAGFKNTDMNTLFVEKNDPRLLVNERETYWPASGKFFIYRSASTNTWGVGKATRFLAIKSGKSNGRAHSPKGFELWLDVNEIQHSGNSTKSWREWDPEANSWKRRAGAGVQSRGKVRPKFGPQCSDAEVQTILQFGPQCSDAEVVERVVRTERAGTF